MSVCLYQSISLTAELIWFSFTVNLLVDQGKVYNYFRSVPPVHPLKRNRPYKKIVTKGLFQNRLIKKNSNTIILQ